MENTKMKIWERYTLEPRSPYNNHGDTAKCYLVAYDNIEKHYVYENVKTKKYARFKNSKEAFEFLIKQKSDINLKDLEFFCFDVLGDLMDPKAYEIKEIKGHGLCVIVRYTGLLAAPKDIVWERWNEAKKDTEFESVDLYMPVN